MERDPGRNPFSLSDADAASPERRRRYALHLAEVHERMLALEGLDRCDGLEGLIAEVEAALEELRALGVTDLPTGGDPAGGASEDTS